MNDFLNKYYKKEIGETPRAIFYPLLSEALLSYVDSLDAEARYQFQVDLMGFIDMHAKKLSKDVSDLSESVVLIDPAKQYVINKKIHTKLMQEANQRKYSPNEDVLEEAPQITASDSEKESLQNSPFFDILTSNAKGSEFDFPLDDFDLSDKNHDYDFLGQSDDYDDIENEDEEIQDAIVEEAESPSHKESSHDLESALMEIDAATAEALNSATLINTASDIKHESVNAVNYDDKESKQVEHKNLHRAREKGKIKIRTRTKEPENVQPDDDDTIDAFMVSKIKDIKEAEGFE